MPKYTKEFKAKAVQLSELDGVMIKDVAESLDIHPYMLSRWRKEYREGRIVADKQQEVVKAHLKGVSDSVRVRQLEREVARLRTENDILKKWQRFLAEQKHSDSNS